MLTFTRERLEALFAPLAGARGLLIAVSGGPDSTALLSLALAWRGECAALPIAAATVDHGLRPESAAEARAVAALCERFGVPHKTLVWQGAKPKTRLQERAREARYGLLVAHARAIGADVIVTAHHLDDQAETVLMRITRGSGVAGLAGMAPLIERDCLTIVRPLLSVSKAELVAYCAAQKLSVFDDPSNRNPAFARARLRELLASEGLDASALARLAERAARADEALTVMTQEAEARLGLAARGVCHGPEFAALPREIQIRVVTRALSEVGGAERPTELEKVETLVAKLVEAQAAGRPFSANLAGAHLTLSRKGLIEVRPEPPRRPIRPGSSRVAPHSPEPSPASRREGR